MQKHPNSRLGEDDSSSAELDEAGGAKQKKNKKLMAMGLARLLPDETTCEKAAAVAAFVLQNPFL